MNSGVITSAPGPHKIMVRGLEQEGITVLEDSELDVDWQFGTPVGKLVRIELKVVPADLVSSIRGQEGRMTRQDVTLGSNDGPSILLLVGYPNFNAETYQMIDDHGREMGFDYFEMMGRQLTLAMIGVSTIWVPNMKIAGKALANIYYEFQKQSHLSHLTRPNFAGSGAMTTWPKPTRAEEILYIWQGFRGFGRSIGKKVWKYTGSLRNASHMTEKQMTQIPGIGKKRASQFMHALDANYDDYFDDGNEEE